MTLPANYHAAAWFAMATGAIEEFFDSLDDHTLPIPAIVARVTAAGGLGYNGYTPQILILPTAAWDVVGVLHADDDVDFIQQFRRALGMGQDDRFFGMVLRWKGNNPPVPNLDPGDFLVLVRGTATGKEWAGDAFAVPEELPASTAHPRGGMIAHPRGGMVAMVAEGFFSYYSSMHMSSPNGDKLGPAAHALASLANGSNAKKVIVTGHSLGSALVAYLTYDLVAMVVTPGNVYAHTYASPKPGNGVFSTNYRNTVPNYVLVNWSADVVPRLPPIGYAALSGTSGTNQEVTTITAANVAARAAAAWAPQDNPFSNHHVVCYARLLDPGNIDAVTITNAKHY